MIGFAFFDQDEYLIDRIGSLIEFGEGRDESLFCVLARFREAYGLLEKVSNDGDRQIVGMFIKDGLYRLRTSVGYRL